MTALVMAARGNAPVVVFAGDAPIGASWYLQSIDQAPLALATGAHFVPIRTIDRALDCVREAFYVARAERKPVVLSVPLDLQKDEFPDLPDYAPSTELMPRQQLLRPDPEVVDEVVAMRRGRASATERRKSPSPLFCSSSASAILSSVIGSSVSSG
jgi:acetolactate synthase I/II/III large subunit